MLGGGLRVGVLHHGKKIRDDSKTLLQAGISHDDMLDNLGNIHTDRWCMQQFTQHILLNDNNCTNKIGNRLDPVSVHKLQQRNFNPAVTDRLFLSLLHASIIHVRPHNRQPFPPLLEKPSNEPHVNRSTNYFLADICI